MSKLTFRQSGEPGKPQDEDTEEKIKVIIADDEPEVHAVTRFVLKDFSYQGKKLEFLRGILVRQFFIRRPYTGWPKKRPNFVFDHKKLLGEPKMLRFFFVR